MCKAISYRRWSNPTQSKGDSKRRQEDDFARFCQAHELTPADIYTDSGVSGWTGSNVDEGALSSILKAIKAGTIHKGYCLVVEQLDRLTRLPLDIGLGLFAKILRAGVNIGHVRKNRILTEKDLSGFGVMEFVTELILANEESSKKSERVKASMSENKIQAAEGRKWSAKGPAWLVLSGKRRDNNREWAIIEEEAAKVRLIYKWCIEGLGVEAIVRRLVQQNVKPMGKSKHWTKGYVLSILRDKIALGWYQPTKMVGKNKRVPDGDPIPNYYKAIITEKTYYDAQAKLDQRARHCGPVSRSVNLIGGLVKDGESGSTMFVAQRKGYKVLYPSAAISGQAKYWSIKLDWLEQITLRYVKELKLEPTDNAAQNQLTILKGKRDQLAKRIKATITNIADTEDFEGDREIIKTLEKSKRDILAKIEKLEAEVSSQPEDTLARARTIISKLDKCPADQLNNLRLQLRANLRELVSEILLRRFAHEETQYVRADIKYSDGEKQRTVWIDVSHSKYVFGFAKVGAQPLSDIPDEKYWTKLQ